MQRCLIIMPIPRLGWNFAKPWPGEPYGPIVLQETTIAAANVR